MTFTSCDCYANQTAATLGNYYVTYQTVITTATTTINYPMQTSYYQQEYYVPINSYVAQTISYELTDEQIREYEQQERDRQAKETARRKRAKDALFLTLNDQQKQQFEKDEFFELQVNARLYRVRPGRRVERLHSETKEIESYFCIHPELHHDLPPEDVAISQKLWLETREDEFLRIANETKAA